MSQAALTASRGSAQPFADPFAWREQRTHRAPKVVRPRRALRRTLVVALIVALAAVVGLHSQAAGISALAHPLAHFLSAGLRGHDVGVEGVTSRLVDDGSALLVEGALLNTTDREIDAPTLRLAVRSADKAEIFVWTAHPQSSHLAPGARTRFSSKLASPPNGGFEVTVSLPKSGG